MQEVVIRIGNAKWVLVEEARQDVERAGVRWGRLGGWEDMVFQSRRTRNLQTLSADTVLSVRVGEDLAQGPAYWSETNQSAKLRTHR